MDEVFGNSSSDTVMEAELSQVLETIRHDIASLHHHHQPQSSTSNTTVAHTISHTQATTMPSHIRAEPLTCSEQRAVVPRSCRGTNLPGVGGIRPVPYPRVISVATPSLRHTQSAVESRVPQSSNSPRPRAFSTSASPQSHSYVNIQACRPVSTYDNVPELAVPVTKPSTPLLTLHTSLPKYMNVPLSSRHSSSAPTTPQRGTSKQFLHHSYIELWSGIQEERDSLSDSECEDLKRSFQSSQTPNSHPSPGYVQMTSPFIKSPQVTSPFNGSVLADFATKLASYAGQQPRNIFCPFCPRYFGYEKSLSSHIHKSHRVEMNSMVENLCNDMVLQICPICQAQFYNSSVLPKHLIDFHRSSVIDILEKHSCIKSDAMGIHCPFCTKMVPHDTTGEQVLLYHMQQLHMSDYNAMIEKKFKPYSATSLESLISPSSEEVADTGKFQPGLTSTPGLSNRLGTMALAVQALNLDTTWSSHTGTLRSPLPPPPPKPAVTEEDPKSQTKLDQEKSQQLASSTSKGILRHQSALGRKPSVKRELRFSVPPVTSEEVFVPESPDPPTTESSASGSKHQQHQSCDDDFKKVIPVRVDSLSAIDFVDLTTKNSAQRKRRRLGLGLRSRKAFKKKDKENVGERELNSLASEASKLASCGKKQDTVTSTVRAQGTRTFRRPKPVSVPRVPELPPATKRSDGVTALGSTSKAIKKEETDSPFINLKLYSPLRMFRCNGCHVKFCDNESLSGHIGMRHKGLLHLLRPQYGCGVCSAKFFENKYLVKHCLQHHTSLLEIRSPCKHKVSVYRFPQD